MTEDKYSSYMEVNQKFSIDGGEYKVKEFADMRDCKTPALALLATPTAVSVDVGKFISYKSEVFKSCSYRPLLNDAFPLVGMTD
jgi:hypothetical protein